MPYKGKHEKKWYVVRRVLGPAGPVRTVTVLGKEAVDSLTAGCWDWDVREATEEEVERKLQFLKWHGIGNVVGDDK